jgi:hypothetical protein
MVYEVFSYFNREASAYVAAHGVARSQERTAEACDMSIETVQRIISERNVAVRASRARVGCCSRHMT